MDPYFGWLSAGMYTGSPNSCYEKINSDNQRLGIMGDLWIDGQNAVAQTLCFT